MTPLPTLQSQELIQTLFGIENEINQLKGLIQSKVAFTENTAKNLEEIFRSVTELKSRVEDTKAVSRQSSHSLTMEGAREDISEHEEKQRGNRRDHLCIQFLGILDILYPLPDHFWCRISVVEEVPQRDRQETVLKDRNRVSCIRSSVGNISSSTKLFFFFPCKLKIYGRKR